MKSIFKFFALFSLLWAITACEEKGGETITEEEEVYVDLIADKSSIVADGTDTVTFTVTINSNADDKGESRIINLNTNEYLDGTTFTTTEAGTYSFMATYGKETSKVVQITATNNNIEPEQPTVVELIADKNTIVADGSEQVTFTVLADEVDVTADAEIVFAINDAPLGSNKYSTTNVGPVTFKAVYMDVESNEVVITATEAEVPTDRVLTLTASTSRIKADGSDSVTFTVKYGEEDVTTLCTIVDTKTNDTIANNTFATTTVGSYTFRAYYDDEYSNTVVVDAYDTAIIGKYEPCTLYNENGVKGVIFAIKEDNHGDTWCYIMSMEEEDLRWSTENVWCNCIVTRGDWNTEDMLRNGTSPDKYPAAQWCVGLGDGWFMPSSTELQWMWDAITDGAHDFAAPKVAEYNKLLTDNGGEPFCETFYWSSNEISEDTAESVAFMQRSVVCLSSAKSDVMSVRAVYRFKL